MKTQRREGGVKIEILVADPTENLDFDEHIILPSVPCGYFALGTLSETCLKDNIFDVHVTQHKLTTFSNMPKCKC